MTACSLRVEIPEKLILSGFQRADIHGDLLSAGDYLLAPQLGAFEFLGRGIVVLDDQGDFLASRDFDLTRLKLMVLDRQHVSGVLRRRAGYDGQNEGVREEG